MATKTKDTTVALPEGSIGTGGSKSGRNASVSDTEATAILAQFTKGEVHTYPERVLESKNKGGYLNAVRSALVRIGVPAESVNRVVTRDGGIGLRSE